MRFKTLFWLGYFTIASLIVVVMLLQEASIGHIWASIVLMLATAVVTGSWANYWFGVQRQVKKHLRLAPSDVKTIGHPIPERDRVNTYLALEQLNAKARGRSPCAFDGMINFGTQYHAGDLSGGAKFVQRADSAAFTSYRYRTLSGGPHKTVRVPESKIYFLYYLQEHSRRPFIAALSYQYLEIIACTVDEAEEGSRLVQNLASELSIYQGNTISLHRKKSEEGEPQYDIQFHELPNIPREQLILPASVLETIDRNITGFLQRASQLRRAGQSTRHGVLFYGPPGTGKSLAVKYLANAATKATTILVSGRQLTLIRESCRLARVLAPAIVVLEDVDLIATDRRQSRNTMLLHDLMDEMDGLAGTGDVVFLLTTNRPEVLEKALTARPGRIDQAIYFPLPDADCRRRFLERATRQLTLENVNLESLVERSAGASPAFLEEWVRRAILFAEERSPNESEMTNTVTADDFVAALREIVETGGELTQVLLGYQVKTKPSVP